jgi:hypothetical protein
VKDNYLPFCDATEFELVELLSIKEKMSFGEIDQLLKLLSILYNMQSPFTSYKELYSLIDAIIQGDIPWNSLSVTYDGPCPPDTVLVMT